ncbi:efflux RND transporter periplasmic adaptor subunit [Flavobacterium branchiophilum]|uniref:Probable membrane fusion efflux lipoprotein n=1 Tax=Flavobacterium branchiophilum (strain FL-15) TaxID=1034807 RepID=G2Z1H7_FLABF|nr:Probable membrane fusion efflux lipoprotein precursor [Flavobacterium branchiophilum FL-15]
MKQKVKKIGCLLALAIIFSCKENTSEKEIIVNDGLIKVTKQQFESAKMIISTPTEQDFDVVVKTSGRIDVPPQNRSKITTFIGGYVKKTQLLVGDKVVKGQALITLSSTEYLDIQKEFLEISEQIQYLKSEYDRQKTLFDEKITSQKNYLKAESDYKKAKGMYQSLKAKLTMLHINPQQVQNGKLTSEITIYAPISGDVTIVNANVGQFVAPSDVMIEIINNNDLHVELNVFEKDILKIKANQAIWFQVPEASKEFFKGSVHLIGKSIEGPDRTINVHGHLDDKLKQKLLTGMFVEAQIVVDAQKGLAVAKEAVINENNKNYVLLLKNSKTNYEFQKVSVKIGAKNDKYIEIIPNALLSKSSKILTTGVFDVIE